MKDYSFIIPHHNSLNLLNRCLDSIPQREDLEIIVIDDNSNDDQKPHVTRADVKIIYIDSEHSKGAGRARNYGLKEAEGRWLVFADADDFFPQNFLYVLDQYKDSNYEVLYHNIIMVDTNTLQPYKRYMDTEMSIVANYDGTSDKEIRYRLNAPWWKIVKRDFVKKYHIEFEEVPKGNDIFFSIQVGFFVKSFAVLNIPLYIYTYNRNGISNAKKDENIYFNEFCVRNRLWGFYKFIGHPEWVVSKGRIWLRIIRHDGPLVFLKTIYKYLTNQKYLRQCEREYTDRIKTLEKNYSIQKEEK